MSRQVVSFVASFVVPEGGVDAGLEVVVEGERGEVDEAAFPA